MGAALSGVCSCFGFGPAFVAVSLRLSGQGGVGSFSRRRPCLAEFVEWFASRAFSQSKLTKCIPSQAKISQRWKSCCRGSPGAVVSLTQQVPGVWLSLCLGRVLFSCFLEWRVGDEKVSEQG